jgi:hypothetical protein
MVQASEITKGILLINKIEKNRNYNKSNGVIKIELYDSYEEDGSDALINILPDFNIDINYSPNLIKITLLDNDYNLEYIVLNLETEDFETYSKIVPEKEIIRILTLFLFDSYTLYDINILDDKNQDFLPINENINPNSPLIGRESMWDTLKYLKYL